MAKRYRPGDVKWVAYPDGYVRVIIVERGSRGFVFRNGNKPENPYVVNEDDEQYVLSENELYDNPIAASVRVAELRSNLGLTEFEDEDEEEEFDDENDEELEDEDDEELEED